MANLKRKAEWKSYIKNVQNELNIYIIHKN